MPPGVLTFQLLLGLSSPDRRAVGLLEGDQQLNATNKFDELRSKDRDTLRSRMDRWCDGQPGPTKYFHGWNEEEHRECMVFKLNDNRFYGFKCHPLPLSSPSFMLCVLNIHAYKRERETDDAELDRVNQWRTNPRTRSAIAQVYSEYGRGKCSISRN
jgi:hypothetical protein